MLFPGVPEIGDDCKHGAGVEHDQQQRHLRGGGVEAQQFFRHDDMGGTGDRQEFGCTLHNSQNDNLEEGHKRALARQPAAVTDGEEGVREDPLEQEKGVEGIEDAVDELQVPLQPQVIDRLKRETTPRSRAV